MIENLESIKKNGIKRFLANEEVRWRCPRCGGVICCPNGLFHEYIHEFFDPMGQVFIDPIKPRNEEISPLNKPGFGLELNEEAIERLKVKPSPEKIRPSVKKGWRWPPYL